MGRADLAGAPVTPAERALLEMAEKITLHAYKTTPEDIQRLRDHGWTDPQIAEMVYVTALFAFFNRVADAFGIQNQGYGGPRPNWDELEAGPKEDSPRRHGDTEGTTEKNHGD